MPSASTVFLHAQIHHLSPEPDAVTLPPSILFSMHGGDRGREGGMHVKSRQTDRQTPLFHTIHEKIPTSFEN